MRASDRATFDSVSYLETTVVTYLLRVLTAGLRPDKLSTYFWAKNNSAFSHYSMIAKKLAPRRGVGTDEIMLNQSMIPTSGYRFSDKIMLNQSMIPKSGYRFSDKIMLKE